MRKSTSKPKYTWQILVIIVTVIILGLNAIPTFYGSNNALLVSAINPTQTLPNTQKLRELMQQQQVDVEQIINGESDSKIVIEGDDETLIQAQAHLKNTLGDDYQVRLGSQSAASTRAVSGC